jgi:hypothetical protein
MPLVLRDALKLDRESLVKCFDEAGLVQTTTFEGLRYAKAKDLLDTLGLSSESPEEDKKNFNELWSGFIGDHFKDGMDSVPAGDDSSNNTEEKDATTKAGRTRKAKPAAAVASGPPKDVEAAAGAASGHADIEALRRDIKSLHEMVKPLLSRSPAPKHDDVDDLVSTAKSAMEGLGLRFSRRDQRRRKKKKSYQNRAHSSASSGIDSMSDGGSPGKTSDGSSSDSAARRRRRREKKRGRFKPRKVSARQVVHSIDGPNYVSRPLQEETHVAHRTWRRRAKDTFPSSATDPKLVRFRQENLNTGAILDFLEVGAYADAYEVAARRFLAVEEVGCGRADWKKAAKYQSRVVSDRASVPGSLAKAANRAMRRESGL